MINPEPKTICIAGASGLAGAYIVKAALNRGFRVHGTLRDASHNEKAGVLRSFASASDRLRLFSADAADSGSFDEPLTGADAVFITCFHAVITVLMVLLQHNLTLIAVGMKSFTQLNRAA